MRKAFLTNASAMLGVPVESLSSPVKFLFSERPKEELSRFIEEINEENAGYMSYKQPISSIHGKDHKEEEEKDRNICEKEGDGNSNSNKEEVELKPTYKQLRQDRIDDQCHKNILMLKSFEHVLEERLFAFNKFLDSLSKTRTSFDSFQYSEGSLRQALDALFVFIEQELQQARQQLSLGDLKKDLTDTKAEASRKATEYQREVAAADADVAAAERSLSKSKETLRKLVVQKKRLEMGGSSGSFKGQPQSPSTSSEESYSGAQSPSHQDLDRNEKYIDNKDQIDRTQTEVRQHIRELLRLIGVRDQTQAAARRAFQQLNKQCKTAMSNILRKVVDREREALAARSIVVDKLDKSVEDLNNEEDEQEFIQSYRVDDGSELVQCSQALSILGDICTIDSISKKDSEMEALSSSGADGSTGRGSVSGTRPPSNPMKRRTSVGGTPASCSAEETTMYLSQIFYLSEWPSSISPQESSLEEILVAVNSSDESDESSDKEQSESERALLNAMQRLIKLSETLEGRKVLVHVLNQFRSRQVNVGEGFKLLAAVMWSLLSKCKSSNDVHNGKIVMILSQTFYVLSHDPPSSEAPTASLPGISSSSTSSSDHEVEVTPPASEESERSNDSNNHHSREDGGARRRYLKELLVSHSIWQEGRFWEQALWQCVLDQLVMMQIDSSWHDLEPGERLEAVRRVHDVIFSQVMAIAHSMLELGCSKSSVREFVYRMCVVHQLGERQQHDLLTHLSSHNS